MNDPQSWWTHVQSCDRCLAVLEGNALDFCSEGARGLTRAPRGDTVVVVDDGYPIAWRAAYPERPQLYSVQSSREGWGVFARIGEGGEFG